MNNQLAEEKLVSLLPALSPLAESIGAGTAPEQRVLKKILHTISVEVEEWAVQEMELWMRILQKARTASTNAQMIAIAAELQSRGIPEFQAILAVDSAIGQLLSVEPQSLDFGCLKPGDGAQETLKVSGGTVTVIVKNNQLKATLLDLGSGRTLVKVTLLADPERESLQDRITLKGERNELKVLVRARWEEPRLVSYCPHCEEVIHKRSLFWNKYDRKFECFHCRREGPSPDKLTRPA